MDYSFEENLFNEGIVNIAGIDEAGRGPLAGPVVAAAVILPREEKISGVNDSKKLTEKQRNSIYPEILKRASVGLGVISEKIIDEINIYQAARLAMKEAVLDLPHEAGYLLIDGTMSIDIPITAMSIVRGDAKSASIAAASIVAKVVRDGIMRKMHEKYPEYDFAQHKGYPTKKHCEALFRHGPCPIHRRSFGPVKRLLQK